MGYHADYSWVTESLSVFHELFCWDASPILQLEQLLIVPSLLSYYLFYLKLLRAYLSVTGGLSFPTASFSHPTALSLLSVSPGSHDNAVPL